MCEQEKVVFSHFLWVKTATFLLILLICTPFSSAFAQTVPPKTPQTTNASSLPLTTVSNSESSNEQDLGYYMSNARKRVYKNWTPAKLKAPSRVVAQFSIDRDGKLVSQSILISSGYKKADTAALEAIKMGSPFEPLPGSFKDDHIDFKYIFDTHTPKLNSESDWALRGCYSRSSITSTEKPPSISSLVISPSMNTLHEGDILSVSLVSTPNSTVSFRIISYTRGITLKETSPGHYEGRLEIGRTGKLESEAEVCVTKGENVTTLILSKPIKIDTPSSFDKNVLFDDRPVDKTDFPIRVYIDPMARNLELADSAEEPLPENKKLWLRQGVLDWVRLLLSSPDRDAPRTYIQILKPQAAEQQEKALLEAGIFSFVENRSKADIVIEGVNQTYLTGDSIEGERAIGIFTQEQGLRIGKITITLKHSTNTGPEEFYLRTVLIHEMGHALGLAHVSREVRCDFMSSAAYECYAPDLEACKKNSETSTCIGVNFAYIKFIESMILAPSRKGPKSALLLLREYANGVEKRIKSELQSSDFLKSAGRLLVEINTEGNLEQLRVIESFGSSEIDEKVQQKVRSLGSFGKPPEAWKEPNDAFYVDVIPKSLEKDL
jgi:TonB family protein